LNASPQLPDLLPEFRFGEVHDLQTDHDRRRCAEPPTRRRARDTEIRGDGQVPGALDEIPEAMVKALLRAGRGPHADDHRPFTRPVQLPRTWHGARRLRRPGSDDNSRRKVQNVRADSSATDGAKRRDRLGALLHEYGRAASAESNTYTPHRRHSVVVACAD